MELYVIVALMENYVIYAGTVEPTVNGEFVVTPDGTFVMLPNEYIITTTTNIDVFKPGKFKYNPDTQQVYADPNWVDPIPSRNVPQNVNLGLFELYLARTMSVEQFNGLFMDSPVLMSRWRRGTDITRNSDLVQYLKTYLGGLTDDQVDDMFIASITPV